jgi:hypothetical protein
MWKLGNIQIIGEIETLRGKPEGQNVYRIQFIEAETGG